MLKNKASMACRSKLLLASLVSLILISFSPKIRKIVKKMKYVSKNCTIFIFDSGNYLHRMEKC